MPRRSILTARQRAALFDLPTDDASMLRHYTLADDDLEIVRACQWRSKNQPRGGVKAGHVYART